MARNPVYLTACALLAGICFLCLPVPFPHTAYGQPADDAMEAEDEAPADSADSPAPATPEESPLATDPKTPAELLQGAMLMADIARPTLAKAYLERLMPLLDETIVLELRDQFGAVAFVRLANNVALRPVSVELLELSNAAAAKRANDPARVAALVAQLSGTEEEQAVSLEELRSTGPAVIPFLIKVLHDPAQAAAHDGVLEGLIHMGDAAVPALIGALDAPAADVRVFAANALGQMESSEAIAYLLFAASWKDEVPAVQMSARNALTRILRAPPVEVARMTQDGVVARLTEVARGYYSNQTVIPTTSSGLATVWLWNQAEQTVTPMELPPANASDLFGTRFAKQALALSPEKQKVQVLYLGLALTAEARRAGWDHPLPTGPGTAHDLALSVGPVVVTEVLRDAIAAGRPLTAVAALRVLEQIGTLAQLKGSRSVLVHSLNYPDERVQYAAATAILQLDPQSTFPGAQRVMAVLDRALRNSGFPKAVVAHQSVERASAVGGLVAELGYEPVVVTSGREAFQLAAERLDVELIVVHPGITRWALTETLANLRADARTANIPIVIQGPAELQPRMQQHLRNYRRITFAFESDVAKDFDTQVRPFLDQVSTPPLSKTERLSQKAAAVSWMAHLAARGSRVFNISKSEQPLSVALQDPVLARDALQALGEIPSARTQTVLAETVTDDRIDPDLRTAATGKLAFHIQRFGMLLSEDLVARLHQAWNTNADPGLHAALGGVIGSLKPTAALTGKRLQSFSVAP